MPRVNQIGSALRCAIDSMSTRKYSVLVARNERLGNLGDGRVEPQSHVVSNSPDALILARIETLELEGKYRLIR
jgi:hypothetical protein